MVSATAWGLPVNPSPTWSLLRHATSARSPRPATSFSRPRVPSCRGKGKRDRMVHESLGQDACTNG